MSHSSNCLNCDQKILGKFCHDCGQKSDTHRITLKHLIFHDILHGIWHFEKGIFFTMKEALTRPGQAALDYISGKRIKYYNVFYLILILIGLNVFLSHYYDELSHTYLKTGTYLETAIKSKSINKSEFDNFIENNTKLIIFSFVPLFAINSFLIFRRKKLNFSEHFIMAGMIYLGIILLSTVEQLIGFLDFFKYIDIVSEIMGNSIPIIIILYVTLSYYNAFKNDYSKIRYALKIITFITLLGIEFLTLALLLIRFYNH
jgi:hypothetical protein